MGIGMVGVFEVRLPAAATVFNPSETGGSFFMGVFTAVLSTPCTGPLLGIRSLGPPPASSSGTDLGHGSRHGISVFVVNGQAQLAVRFASVRRSGVLLKQVMGMLLVAVAIWFLGNAGAGLLPAA